MISQAQIEEALRAIAKVDLPDFDKPVKYFFKDSLPHTRSGEN